MHINKYQKHDQVENKYLQIWSSSKITALNKKDEEFLNSQSSTKKQNLMGEINSQIETGFPQVISYSSMIRNKWVLVEWGNYLIFKCRKKELMRRYDVIIKL